MEMRKLALSVVVFSMLWAGCFTFRVGPEREEIRLWSLGPEHTPSELQNLSGPDVLVRDLGSALLYETRDLVAVTDSGMVTLASDDRWIELPATMISDALAAALSGMDGFGSVVRSDPEIAEYALDGRLLELGARRISGEWHAAVGVELRFGPSCGGQLLLSRVYSRRRPLSSLEYSELVAALRELTKELVEEAAMDVALAAGLRTR